jgi:competence protein ComEA
VADRSESRAPWRRLGAGAIVVIVVVAFAITVAIGILRGGAGAAEEIPAVASPSPAAVEGAPLYAHVAGAVRAPGLYALPPGSRVVDAVAAAGGFADEAEQAAVNLARPIADGEQIVVPRVGEVPPPAEGGSAGSTGGGADAVVDLNTADLAALDTLPGIGPALAARIIAWRDENGRFASIEDLLAVSGIGERLLEGLRDRVRV